MYKDEVFAEQCQICPFTSWKIFCKSEYVKAEKWGSKLKKIVFSKKVENFSFRIGILFLKWCRTTLTGSNKLQIGWGYVEWTLVRCSCVFFHWLWAVFKCHQPKVEVLHLKNDFFQFGIPFFNLNVLWMPRNFICSYSTYSRLFSENFILLHQ